MKPTFNWSVFLLLATISVAAAGEKENLRLVLDNLDKVKDAEHIFKTDLTFDKVDGNKVKITGQIVQSVDIDDDYKITLDVLHSSEKDGEYKKVMGFANMGFCAYIADKYKKYFYDTLKDYANAPDPDKCPMTKETYVIKDYPFESTKFQKYLRPGFYKTIISLINADEEVMQYTIEAHTENE